MAGRRYEKIIADRWMMESRQIVNWGSYDGYQEFRPSIDAESPVTLLAAPANQANPLVDARFPAVPQWHAPNRRQCGSIRQRLRTCAA